MNMLPELHRLSCPNDSLWLWLKIIGDAEYVLAYYAIPLMLWGLVKHHWIGMRMGRWVFILFGAFILLCGTTHIFDIWTVFAPVYWLQIVNLHLGGVISLYTAFLLRARSGQLLSVVRSPEMERDDFHEMTEFLRRARPA